MLTATTPDYLAHISTTSRRAVLLSVVPGAEPPAKGVAASATVAFAPVIEVEQQEEGQLEGGSGGRDLQSLVEGSSSQHQQTAGGLQFFALPALMHSTAPDTTAPQASLTEPVMVGGRRSLLCFNCPKCAPGQFAVVVDGSNYACFTCPAGFYCDGSGGGYLGKCPEQCSSCTDACRDCESSQVDCRMGARDYDCQDCGTCLKLNSPPCQSWPSADSYNCNNCQIKCSACQRCNNPPGSRCSECASCQQKCKTITGPGTSSYKSCKLYGYTTYLPSGRHLQGTGEAETAHHNIHSISTAQE
jgi:hypothetical protein